jgi:RNA polymerase sigma-70 factor (ECF subfamily)
MHRNLDHETLISLLESGNPAQKERAFRQIFSELYEREMKYAYFILDNMDDAKDVAQQTFMQFWQLSRYRHIKPFSAYIRKMSHSNCLLILRERSRAYSRAEELSGFPSYEKASFDELPELKAAIESATSSLQPSHYRALQLYYMSNLKQKEGAELMGISTKAFKNYVYMAVVQLRMRLRAYL